MDINQQNNTYSELDNICLDIKNSLVIDGNNIDLHQKTEDTKVKNLLDANTASDSSLYKLNDQSSSYTTVYLDCSDKTSDAIEKTLYESVYEEDVSESTIYESFSEGSLYFSTVDKTDTLNKDGNEKNETVQLHKFETLKNKCDDRSQNLENNSGQIYDLKLLPVAPVIEGLANSVIKASKTGMWNTCITLLESKLDHSHMAYKQLQMIQASFNSRTGILYIACELGCKELISVFIANDFHVNRVIHHYSGSTMLHVAALSRHIDLVKYLLASGASPNAEDKWKYTPLHLAALLNRFEMAKLLVRGGAKIGVKNAYGNTPLHEAALCGSKLIVQFLLDNNSNTRLLNRNGKTAEDVARISRFNSVADLLSFIKG